MYFSTSFFSSSRFRLIEFGVTTRITRRLLTRAVASPLAYARGSVLGGEASRVRRDGGQGVEDLALLGRIEVLELRAGEQRLALGPGEPAEAVGFPPQDHTPARWKLHEAFEKAAGVLLLLGSEGAEGLELAGQAVAFLLGQALVRLQGRLAPLAPLRRRLCERALPLLGAHGLEPVEDGGPGQRARSAGRRELFVLLGRDGRGHQQGPGNCDQQPHVTLPP